MQDRSWRFQRTTEPQIQAAGNAIAGAAGGFQNLVFPGEFDFQTKRVDTGGIGILGNLAGVFRHGIQPLDLSRLKGDRFIGERQFDGVPRGGSTDFENRGT